MSNKVNIYVVVFVCLSIAAGQSSAVYCNNGRGECKEFQYCHSLYKNSPIDVNSIHYCDLSSGIVCCPRTEFNFETRFGTDTYAEMEQFPACMEYAKFAPSTCSGPLIYGGVKAKPKEFPSVALLGTKDNNTGAIDWYCGGTLISRRFVITAAHCFRVSTSINIVRLGELDYNTTNDDTQTQDFNVVHAVLHPSYNLDRYNDIALIELDRDAILNEYVIPACLPPKTTQDTRFTAVGWGKTEKGDASSHLLKVELDLFTGDQCAKSVPVQENLEMGLKERTQICAGSHKHNIDTCNGDSGGPLYVRHKSYHCMLQLAAITSFGYVQCGTADIPSINTKVNLYLSWIENVVWDVSPL
ncbi:phenoloxidase-activating factor 1 isoform X1 [Zeugodacus cucurbitae]|uniref:phenoloxidase-activating factor 1 isoform X1 n=1 Tax=Zeugodacus cucurbitae TaxID=28588 RepID=UPI0023D93D8E|nr:phenoloxidase-activating factor 1 isoform X1 [Zeugodacus cucurbitae]